MNGRDAMMEKTARALLPVAAVVALSFLLSIFFPAPYPFGPMWKAAGIALLGVYALLRRAPLVATALFFSAGGDVALDLSPPAMVAGMALFGVAHLLYIAAFANLLRKEGAERKFEPYAKLVLAASLAMLAWFWGAMGDLLVPGVIYHAIITAMVMLALVSPASALAKAGALVFMISDALIALTLYRDIPVVPGAVWLTYVAAQIMLAKGLTVRSG